MCTTDNKCRAHWWSPKSNLVYCQQRYIWPILRYVMYLGSIGCSSIKWNTCYSVWQRLDTPVWWQTRDTWQWLSVAHNQHAKYYSNSKCVSSQLQQAWVVHWRDHTLNADHTQAIFLQAWNEEVRHSRGNLNAEFSCRCDHYSSGIPGGTAA